MRAWGLVRSLPVAFLLLLGTGGNLRGQELHDTSFPSYELGSDGAVLALAREHRLGNLVADQVERDYRWEGVVIGGLLVGATAAYVGNRLCNEDNSAVKRCTGPTVGGFLVGATVGVVTGGLIGSAIPKR